jgi:outer membrane protein OmpA-like peptidoglycan-associated protein/osmotically-inducible protein OsmY
MRTFLAVLLALIALGILAYFCINQHAPVIAADLNQRASDALAQGNHSFARIDGVSGRDVTLSGEAPTEEAKRAALAAVDKVWGVRTAVDNITVAAAAPAPEPAAPAASPASTTPYLFQAALASGTLTLSGAVPSDEARTQFLEAARADFPGVAVRDEMVVREGAPSADWADVARVGLTQLSRFKAGDLKLEDLTVTLNGTVGSQQIYTAVDKTMQELPAAFTARFNATVDAPAAEPPPAAEPATPPAQPEPPAPQPTPAEREVAQNCQREFNRAFRGQTINFETSSARITRSSNRLLRRLAGIADGCPKARFRIEGHTDNQGGTAANQRLSVARAEAVKDALAGLGVARARMSARGFGETRPVANNRTERGRAANRRIEFVVR